MKARRLRLQQINSILDIAENYDAFLIDQWGVLHNGLRPYDNALETLTALRKLGKRIVIITNSAKRAEYNVNQMVRLGFKNELFDHLISSGEAFYLEMKHGQVLNSDDLCYHITVDLPGNPWPQISFTKDLTLAKWIIISTINKDFDVEGCLKELAKQAQLAPMVCLNPDRLAVFEDSSTFFAPGYIASEYEKMGGVVEYFGKPYPAVYDISLQQTKTISSRVLAIGDSIEHDLRGAKTAGIDALFIGHGIFSSELKNGGFPAATKLVASYETTAKYYSYSFK